MAADLVRRPGIKPSPSVWADKYSTIWILIKAQKIFPEKCEESMDLKISKQVKDDLDARINSEALEA